MLNAQGLARAFRNSLYISIPATLMPIGIAAFAAYAFAWMDFRGRGVLFAIVVGLLVVPLQMTFVPVYILYNRLGLTGTFAAIWLAHTGYGLPFSVYLLRNFIGALPRDLFESAFLDGAGSHGTAFLRLALPLSVPSLASLVIFQFLWVWNDLLVALIYLGGRRGRATDGPRGQPGQLAGRGLASLASSRVHLDAAAAHRLFHSAALLCARYPGRFGQGVKGLGKETAMLEQVALEPKQLDDYRAIVGEEVIAEIRRLAEPLRGARVVHINATAYGGGVAEILRTLAPLMRDAGLDAEWQVIEGKNEFFDVTKAMHNGLQGMETPFTTEMQSIWQQYNEHNARRFEGDYDYVIVHDPQPAGLLYYHGHLRGRRWLWRCHIDTSSPYLPYWDFLAPYVEIYDVAIFTMKKYVASSGRFQRLEIIAPTIDPLSPKNRPIERKDALQIVANYGLDVSRPLLTQISRFDPWKDQLGVIDAYRIVKKGAGGATGVARLDGL